MRSDQDRHRGRRPAPRHRVRVAVLALGTASGLVALFHYDGALPLGVSNAALGEPASDAGAVAGGTPAGAAPAGAAPAGSAGPGGDAVVDGGQPAPGRTAASGPAPERAGSPTAKPVRTRTVLGAAADTQWGVVQVRIGVRDGKIVSSQAVQSPKSNATSLSINARALPLLGKQAVAAQTGEIDGVSGATVTSGGYRESLQAAIDKANLA
jgi:uncharacterized protein with FMN-binding domain